MNSSLRLLFDSHVDAVLAELPDRVHELLAEVPMHVDDRPSSAIMRELGLRRPDQLCGLHAGVALSDRSVLDPARLPNVVCLYREGILAMCRKPRGGLDEEELERQIRITILHELGHYHGLDEDELSRLGYG